MTSAFTLADGYVLDVLPSDREAGILRQLRAGDRLVMATHGRGCVWERGNGRPPPYLVAALFNKQWVSRPHPDGPLFGEPTDGTLTLRGSYALRRYETR